MTDSIRAAAERLQQAWDEHGDKWQTHHEDAWNAALHEFFDVLAAQPPAPAGAPPSGYAYRYPYGIRFNNGCEVNGCRPIEVIPYWFSQPPSIHGEPPSIDTPLDLDALLSPKLAYEPGTGQEDGAQLLTGTHGGNPQWWAPQYGCDTLDTLLDRIRTRILPHLRPPIAGIDVPGPDGDYGGLQELCDAEGVDVRIGAPLLRRAREAWGSPAPAPASDGEREEREELAAWLERHYEYANELGRPDWGRMSARAATLLCQPAPAPAVVPVAVSERLPAGIEQALIKAECALADIAEGEPDDNEGDSDALLSWAEQRAANALARIRPVMRERGILTSEWPPLPQPPQGGEVGE